MKGFLKNVLANIVAIFVMGFILFVFFVIFISFSMMSADETINIKKNSVLTLNSKVIFEDAPTENSPDLFKLGKEEGKRVLVYDVVQSIKKAKNDDKIKGISIELNGTNAGITQLSDIRNAIEDFKKSGKFVYAYGNTVSQKAYYLGSVADQYFLNPMGAIELKGMSTEVVFLKNLAEKIGIDIQVIRHGKFKAAVEPFIKNEISPENQEQLSTLLNDLWGNTAREIRTSRKIDSLRFKTTVDSVYGIIPELSVKYNLVDKLVQKSEYDNFIKTKLHIDKDEKINKISIADFISKESEIRNEQKDHIAILYASGEIKNGKGYNGIYDKNLIKEIKALKDNDKVKGVVLRVNSPGGSANASDQILFELEQLKAKKPLVVSFGDYAASGGYYIAMAGEKIYSEPNTITGSIGVFGIIPNAKNLAHKNGVRADVVKTNDNANFHSVIQGLSPGALTMMTKSVESTYKRFVHFVSKNRKKSFEQIDAVGGGRVWSGTKAKEIGLVDELGSLDDAIAYLGKKVGEKEVIGYPIEKTKWEILLESLNEDKVSSQLIERKIGKENLYWFEYFTQPQKYGQTMMMNPYRVKFE